MAKPRVHLVDASPYIFRAYFALPDTITDAAGQPAQAVYGFASFLLRLFAEEEVSHVGVAFDESLTTSFRNDIHPDYKSTRALPPPELEAQQKACQDVARALGCATFVSERYEADDLIGTLCAGVLAEGARAVVVTSDKDLGQLVGPRVELLDFARGDRWGPDEVEAKFGVRPEQLVDWLALAGDPTDDIPGVKGIGKKSAALLLSELGDLDAIYADLERVEGLPIRGARSLARKLAEGREAAELSRLLATIAVDAPVAATLADLELAGADPAVLDPIFDALGFGTLRERVPLRPDAT